MRRLFIVVANPTQMMNAIEARAHYQNSFDQFVLVLFSESQVFKAQASQLIDSNWLIKTFDAPRGGRMISARNIWKRRQFIIQLVSEAQESDVLMIGNILHYAMCCIASRWKGQRQVNAMDDGLGTVNWDLNLNGAITWSPRPPRGWKGILESWILGSPVIDLNKLKFFSIYPLQHFEHLDRNHFNILAQKFALKSWDEKTVYFLDQPLVELGLIVEHDYERLLNEISSFYTKQGYQLVIICHRAAHQRIKIHGLSYLQFDRPIELVLADEKTVPARFATFYSSGAYHLAMIGKNNIKVDFWRIRSAFDEVIVQRDLMDWLQNNALDNMYFFNGVLSE